MMHSSVSIKDGTKKLLWANLSSKKMKVKAEMGAATALQ